MPTPIEPASEILPFLYLGSDTIPQSVDGIDILKKMGITHVLNMAQEVENKQIDQSGQFEVKWCMAEDHAEHDIEHTLKEAIEWIEGARQKSGKNIVFVHCKAGRSRSATTVIGYLVAHRGMSLKEAYETVKAARPGVSPNLGFMLALLKIEKEVRGETSSVLDCSA
ncbi:protein-tyrosine phosphatase-like protein [Phlyctochytrium arcticum]|nr:protein-tyrosine phosphatase-like protein [Phlyctochytrium arcticum]